MARRRWVESLHPRGKGGKFIRKGKALAAKNRARREGNRPANRAAASQRRAAYTLGAGIYGINLYGAAVGYKTYGHASTPGRVGAGVSLAGATASSLHAARAAREVTSKRHADLTPSQRSARVAQLQKRQKQINRTSQVATLGGIAAGIYGVNPKASQAQAKKIGDRVFRKADRKAASRARASSKAWAKDLGLNKGRSVRSRIDAAKMRRRSFPRTRR